MARGGRRSGAGRPRLHKMTHQIRCIDIRQLVRDQLLVPDTELQLGWWDGGELIASISLAIGAGALRISYHLLGLKRDVAQWVCTTTTPCHYGGARVWFECPQCSRRCAKLYIDTVVACRQCQRLTYPTQSLGVIERTWVAQRKLAARLEDASTLGKPVGMHFLTYERIRWRILRLEQRRVEAMQVDLQRWFAG